MKQLRQNMRNGKIEIREIPITQPDKGMALIRNAYSLVSAGTERTLAAFAEKNLVEKAASRPDLVKQVVEKAKREGILSTFDAAMNRLDQPMYPGYSSAGKVAALGAEMTGFQIGDRVACGGGNYAVHAEYCTVPRNLIVKLPDSVSDEQAAFATLGAVAIHGFRLAAPQLNETVLVIGLGLLGLLEIQIAAAAGCQVMGIDISPERVKTAQGFGCAACLRDQVSSHAAGFTRGRGFDHVLICAGSSDNNTIELAGTLCRDRGNVVAIGAVGLDIPRKIFYEKEIGFIVSRSYGPGRYDSQYEEKGQDYPIGYVRWTEGRNMEAFIDLVASGKVDPTPLITHRIPIAEGKKAYDLIRGKTDERSLGVLIAYPESASDEAFGQPIFLKRSAEQQPVSVGVIGAGNYATATFLPVMKACKEPVTFKSIASNRGATAREVAEKYGFEKVEASAEALLADAEVNTAVILTRHDLHAPLVMRALEQGKHVYCEKPLALDMDSLEAVYQAAQAHPQQILMVGYNRRFAPLTVKLQEFLGNCTEPLAMHYTVNAGYLPPSHWVHDPQMGGGRILGECCHMIDLMIALTGARPLQVSALGLPNGGRYVDDNVSLQLKFENGSVGTIHYLANGDKLYEKERLEVFSSGKIAVLNDFRSLDTWADGAHNVTRSSLRIDKGHAASWGAFTQAILQAGQPPIPMAQLFETSLTTFAALASMQANEPVLIPNLDIFS